MSDLSVKVRDSDVTIVDEIDLAVAPGEVLGVVGESGSGKSTVALALLGYTRRGLSVAGGAVYVDGQDVYALSDSQLRRARGSVLAYVPQDPGAALNPALRLQDQLNERLSGVSSRGSLQEVASQIFAEVGLPADPDFRKRYPHQLSGGQRQRVTIAMAFAGSPKVIVLDEPTTSLDVSTQRLVLDTVRTMCDRRGVAAVYVSHDLAVVADLATRVAVMYAGRVVEVGQTDDIVHRPVHPYSRGLLMAVPSASRAVVLRGIEGAPPAPAARPAGCAFAPRCPRATEVCLAGRPELRVVGNRHIRCFHAEELLATPLTKTVDAPIDHSGSAPPLLGVRGLSARYGDRRVLENLDFDIASNGCTAIVGESGSGKTTLARAIAGLHSDRDGTMTLDSETLHPNIRRRSLDQLRAVRYVFQNPYASLNPRRRVGDIVGNTLRQMADVRGGAVSGRVAAALSEVSLPPELAHRYPGELSGGERQRVAIARALVVRPKLLICDEVTSSLDASAQAIIVELLRKLQSERDLTIVFITHNIGLVRSVAQSCIVLANGSIVESGSVETVLGSPRHPYTISLMNDVPRSLDS